MERFIRANVDGSPVLDYGRLDQGDRVNFIREVTEWAEGMELVHWATPELWRENFTAYIDQAARDTVNAYLNGPLTDSVTEDEDWTGELTIDEWTRNEIINIFAAVLRQRGEAAIAELG